MTFDQVSYFLQVRIDRVIFESRQNSIVVIVNMFFNPLVIDQFCLNWLASNNGYY